MFTSRSTWRKWNEVCTPSESFIKNGKSRLKTCCQVIYALNTQKKEKNIENSGNVEKLWLYKRYISLMTMCSRQSQNAFASACFFYPRWSLLWSFRTWFIWRQNHLRYQRSGKYFFNHIWYFISVIFLRLLLFSPNLSTLNSNKTERFFGYGRCSAYKRLKNY